MAKYTLGTRAIQQIAADHRELRSQLKSIKATLRKNPPRGGLREDFEYAVTDEKITARTTTDPSVQTDTVTLLNKFGNGLASFFDFKRTNEGTANDPDWTQKLEKRSASQIRVYNPNLVPIPPRSLITVSRNFQSGLWVVTDKVQTIIGKASGSITARSGSTAGSGTMSLYYCDKDGTLTDSGDTVDVINIASSAVTAGAFITAKLDSLSQRFVVDMEDCT